MSSRSTPRKSARKTGGRGSGKSMRSPAAGSSQQSRSSATTTAASASAIAANGSPPSSSSDRELRSKLARAAALEAELSSLSSIAAGGGGGGSEAKITRTSMELCEILSDVLLTDPSLAARKDVAGRLWRGCFYGRIGELRGRIQREKNRAKRAAAASSSSSSSSSAKNDGRAAANYRKAAEELELSFRTFLDEAVVLYEYLVDKYRDMLLPPQSQTQSQKSDDGVGNGHSQDSGSSASLSPKGGGKKRRGAGGKENHSSQPASVIISSFEVPSGVVPTLHKMYIHLGDLHRYARAYGKAESCYTLSSRLAPGKGNPYNQLAVVAQLRGEAQQSGSADGRQGAPGAGGQQQSPQTAVALYWYSRSLLAVGEPFPTSRTNLTRLFAVNCQWLDRRDLMAEDHEIGGESPGSVEILSAKTQQERARAAKSAAARKFLALFVDLHWDLFRGVAPSSSSLAVTTAAHSDTHTSSPATVADVIGKMRSLLSDLSCLLNGSTMAFGDSLLCKLVAVNAFACCNAHVPGGSSAASVVSGDNGVDKFGGMDISRALARCFTFAFGGVLAEHVAKAAEKLEHKWKDSNGATGGERSIPSLRLLLPLALTCDFVTTLYVGEGDNHMSMDRAEAILAACADVSGTEFLGGMQGLFWENVASLGNILSQTDLPLTPAVDDDVDCNHLGALPSSAPREYEGLRGYAPFKDFLPVHKVVASVSNDSANKKKKDAYLSSAEAASALESCLEGAGSSKGSGRRSKNDVENLARFLCFESFVERHLGDLGTYQTEAGKFLVRGDNGSLSSAFCSSHPPVEPQADSCDMSLDAKVDKAVDVCSKSIAAQGGVPAEVGIAIAQEMISVAEDKEKHNELLVYKSSDTSGGTGPALLVPSDLLLRGSNAKKAECIQKLSDTGSKPGTDLLRPGAFLASSAVPATTKESGGEISTAKKMIRTEFHTATDILPQSVSPKPPPGFTSGSAPIPLLGADPVQPYSGASVGTSGFAVSAPAPRPPPGFFNTEGLAPTQNKPLQNQSETQGVVPPWLAGSGGGGDVSGGTGRDALIQPSLGLGFPTSTANPFASFAQGFGSRAPAPRVPRFNGLNSDDYNAESANMQDAAAVETAPSIFGTFGSESDLFGLRSLGLLSSDESRGGNNRSAKNLFDPLGLPTGTRNPFFAS